VTHLELLNTVLALRFEQPGWPPILKEGGYQVHGVGVAFKLADGREVVPDILASSVERGVTLLVEVKGGGNIDHGQAGRFEAVTVEDLRDRAYLPIPDIATHRIGVVYACAEAQAAAIAAALSDRSFTVVSFDGSSFKVGGADLPDAILQEAWASAKVGPLAPPLRIVPFDKESDSAVVARHVLPALVALLVRGVARFGVDDVLHQTHATCLEAMQPTGSGSELNDLRQRIRDVLRKAVDVELSDVLECLPTNPVQWQFLVSLPADQKGKTRTLQSLQKKASELVERLGGGASQLELFLDEA
jgi:hypothetical protein